MQSDAAARLGSLRYKRGEEMVSPCMGGINILGSTFEAHLEDVNILNAEARNDGFEFKLKTVHLNSPRPSFADVCSMARDASRRRKQKADQLSI